MNHSPNLLKDTMRINDGDLNEIGIIKLEGDNTYYLTRSNIQSFMEDCDVENLDIVISGIKEFYGIKDVGIISEKCKDEDLCFIGEIMSLLELDAREVIKTADGISAFTMYIDQAAALILKRKYDKVGELNKYIDRCDRVLEDIAEEKKVAKDKANNDSYKFTINYIYRLSKNIFTLFIAPLVMTKASIKWPAAVLKLFNGKEAKLFKGITSNSMKAETWKKIATSGFKVGEIFLDGIPSDLQNLYLSINDYEKLLNHYEYKIKSLKAGYEYQVKQLELKDKEEKNKMLDLKEEVIPSDDVEVQYMSPAEIEGKPERERVVLHDEDKDDNACPGQKAEIEEPAVPTAPSVDEEIKAPEETPKIDSPIAAVNMARSNPANVMVTKFGDKYYIDINDLKKFMAVSNFDSYDDAVDKVIGANDDPTFCRDTVKVLMGNAELENCSPEDKEKLESAEVDFEIYPSK